MSITEEVNELVEANDGYERDALVLVVTQLREANERIKSLEERAKTLYNDGFQEGAETAATQIKELL